MGYNVHRIDSEEDVARVFSLGSPLKHDPDFSGPKKRRSCTDIICLLLFCVFIAVWVAVACYAFKKGDPEKLVRPTDSFGHRCGEDNLRTSPDLFLFDLMTCLQPGALWSGCKTPQVCVNACPNYVWIADIYLGSRMPFNQTDVHKHLICTNASIIETVTNSEILQSVIDKKACARWYFPSQSIYFRCIPRLDLNVSELIVQFKKEYGYSGEISFFTFDDLEKAVKGLESFSEVNQAAQNVLRDLKSSGPWILLFSLAALIVSLIYIALLRYLAGIMIWLSILALLALSISGSYFSFKTYKFLKDNPTGRVVPDGTTVQAQVSSILNQWQFWMCLFVFCIIVLFLVLMIVIFLRKRIYIAVALIKEASKAVGSTISTLFFPVFPWLLQIGVLMFSITVFMFLYSTGDNIYVIEGMDDRCTCTGLYQGIQNNASCTIQEFNGNCHQTSESDSHCFTAGCAIRGLNTSSTVFYLQLINLFGFFWGVWFVSGLSQMILAGTFATWYWTFQKRKVPFFVLTRSIIRTFWYHLGTVAFGSLILAICSFIRAMLEYAEKKLKKFENPVTNAIFCCMKCFFYCLEKFLCFVNRNAYIMCAVHGKNFCSSAKDAFELLMRNVIRVFFVDKVTDFLLFLGKLVVTAAVVCLSYPIFNNKLRLLDNSGRDVTLYFPWLPMVIVGIMAYIIASIFFSVYTVAVDTLFLCFLEDSERNDGSEEKPYFMSKELMKILGKKNFKNKKH